MIRPQLPTNLHPVLDKLALWAERIAGCQFSDDNHDMNWLRFSRFLATLSLLACIGCWPLISHDEVARVSSPDGQIDAILFESNGGATTSFLYEVDPGSKQSRRGKQVARLVGAVRNAQAFGVDLNWKNDHTPVIQCLHTETPPEMQSSVDVDGRNVQIVLHTGIEDKSAPAGGMLYNLRKR